jgi:hypothetical protein
MRLRLRFHASTGKSTPVKPGAPEVGDVPLGRKPEMALRDRSNDSRLLRVRQNTRRPASLRAGRRT